MSQKVIYFQCKACRKTFKLNPNPQADIAKNIRDAGGYLIQGYEVYCEGLCGECAAKANAVKKPENVN